MVTPQDLTDPDRRVSRMQARDGSRPSAGSLARGRGALHRSLRRDDGMVTVETALVIPLLVVIAGLLTWLVSLGVTSASLGDIARDAARAVGRGESAASILGRDDIDARVLSDGQQVTVIVRRDVRAPLFGTTVTIEQHATALAEFGVS